MSTVTTTQIESILDFSTTQFMMYGIRSVSMDDLANKLGMSKKTLYQHFSNKKDLVLQSLTRHIKLRENLIHEISRTATDAIDEMSQIAESTVIQFRQIKPTLTHDLQKYYRDIWETVVLGHSNFIQKCIEANIVKGLEEGYYRPGTDADIVSKLYVAASLSLVDENYFSLHLYQRETLIRQFILYHLHGILSEKGRKHLLDFNPLNI